MERQSGGEVQCVWLRGLVFAEAPLGIRPPLLDGDVEVARWGDELGAGALSGELARPALGYGGAPGGPRYFESRIRGVARSWAVARVCVAAAQGSAETAGAGRRCC